MPANPSLPWFERERVLALARFLGRRFVEDRLFQAAGALAYTTVFALVPLTMVVVGVVSAFPVFEQWRDRLTDFVFSNFVPSSARAVETYLLQFSGKAAQLTGAGVVALVASLLITLNGVETAFNRIWRVSDARPKLIRFLVYWTAITLGALVATSSLALSSRVFALALFDTDTGRWLQELLIALAPWFIEWLAFATLYRVVPHRRVAWRHALTGAALATLLFEAIKAAFGLYLGSFNSYQRIYGAVAFAPIFLVWIYLTWVVILLGASLASALAAFRYRPRALRPLPGDELRVVLRLLGHVSDARATGRGLDEAALLRLEPGLDDRLLQRLITSLTGAGLLARSEVGEWLLARDLERTTVAELYEHCLLRVPLQAQAQQAATARDARIAALLDNAAQPLAATFSLPLAAVIHDPPAGTLSSVEVRA
jgi:membrane protein